MDERIDDWLILIQFFKNLGPETESSKPVMLNSLIFLLQLKMSGSWLRWWSWGHILFTMFWSVISWRHHPSCLSEIVNLMMVLFADSWRLLVLTFWGCADFCLYCQVNYFDFSLFNCGKKCCLYFLADQKKLLHQF